MLLPHSPYWSVSALLSWSLTLRPLATPVAVPSHRSPRITSIAPAPTRVRYSKGLVREVAEFLFGTGFAIAEGDIWKGRRRAVVPSLHKAYIEAMVEKVFSRCTTRLEDKLTKIAAAGTKIDMEAQFSQLTLDIIGLSVFNYDYDALTADSPVIQAVYLALKETEQRATDLLPVWKVPFVAQFSPRQQKAAAAVQIIRQTTEELIAKCKEIVEREQEFATLDSEYMNASDPSVLRFLLASRVEVSESQLRDDLLSMLVAGHETTGSVLTWTLKLLVENPDKLAIAVEEAERVMAGRETVTLAMTQEMKYIMRCINESMRLYPHPPVLIRRAMVADTLPGGFKVPVGQDIIISVYNIHRSPAVWDRPDEFIPERFPCAGPALPPAWAATPCAVERVRPGFSARICSALSYQPTTLALSLLPLPDPSPRIMPPPPPRPRPPPTQGRRTHSERGDHRLQVHPLQRRPAEVRRGPVCAA